MMRVAAEYTLKQTEERNHWPTDSVATSEVAEEDAVGGKSTGGGNQLCQAMLCVTPAETLALVLSHDVVVEITLHKHVRICRIGSVAATICRGGRVAAVHHPSVEIVQQETQV